MKTFAITLVLGIILAVFITWEMLSFNQSHCEVCVEFDSRPACAKASGPNEALAREDAHRSACSLVSSGVTSTLACQRTPPIRMECQ